ncbi:unnamed protein product [marine sediment metagenome]|uniref:Uncharacterized protein n=1 Tax=marine sediment metagenome TaxID=412755 RepID=X1PJN2_9ZZZZ
MGEIFTVETRGVGKPDYSREVSRAIQRAGINLAYGQVLKTFMAIFTARASPFAWVLPPLASGVSQNLIDCDTDQVMPFTVPQGYVLSQVQDQVSVSEDAEIWGILDGDPVVELMVISSGQVSYRNVAVPFTTGMADPTGASSHQAVIEITNLGAGNMIGTCTVVKLLDPVGTEALPTTKLVRCKHCSHQWEVPCETTNLICPKCGLLTRVFDLTRFLRSP